MQHMEISTKSQAPLTDGQGVELCLVPVFAALRLEELTEKLATYADQSRLNLRRAEHQNRITLEALSIFLEESNNSARQVQLERIKNLSEKSLGPWFWRKPRGDLLPALRDRREHLADLGYSIDWQWDLLVEIVFDWTGGDNEELLRGAFAETEGSSRANAS